MTQKITMGSHLSDRQRAIDAENAMRQYGGYNPNAGDIPAVMPSAPSSTANAPADDPMDRTGSVALGTSGTEEPNQSSDQFQSSALEGRLQNIAKGLSNAYNSGNNNRSVTGSIG
jgi:hypothetical protein